LLFDLSWCDRRGVASTLALLLALTSTAQSEGAETIRYPSGSAQIEAAISRPSDFAVHSASSETTRQPAVLIVHDDLGLNDTIRALADVFARAGFVALAPNLASRGPGTQPMSTGTQGAGTMNRLRLPIAQTVSDTMAGFSFLQQQPDVEPARISAIGVGWGGFRVWRLAQQARTLHRAVVFYAVSPTDGSLAGITSRIQGHYAQHDFILSAGALSTQKQMGSKFSYFVYPTGRGFLSGVSKAVDPGRLARELDVATTAAGRVPQTLAAGADDRAIATLALRRTLAFLRE
jgi:carboxymethylenebutenolidase